MTFLRSRAGDDPVTCLWAFDPDERDGPAERLVCDPADLDEGGAGGLPAEERARRERVRESAEGIVAYATDPGLTIATFALGGRIYASDLATGGARRLAAGPGFDPRPDPTGRRVAFAANRALFVLDLTGGEPVRLIGEDDPEITWGLAEFVAAEEMGRTRGYWWAPDGRGIIAARVDTGPVQRWHIANPVEPAHPPTPVAYPAAGTANALVTLAFFELSGRRVDVVWDRDAFPYLVRVGWRAGHPLTLLVQSRDQRRTQVLTADEESGTTSLVREDRSETWLEIVPGVPDWLDDGRLVTTVDEGDTRRLAFDGEPVTPLGLQVRAVASVSDRVVLTASDESTETPVWQVAADGRTSRITAADGVYGVSAGGDAMVLTASSMDEDGSVTTVLRRGVPVATIASFAERPNLTPRVSLLRLGGRELRSALLLPSNGSSEGSLPVLLDPYGGPHAQRVVKARAAFLQPQWFADQGFAVLVSDGRGTPARGLAWEHAVLGDLASVPLEDQVEALHAAAEQEPRLDLSRVAIRGWSFGGYLAALAVLRRPDVFHAAVAGAPVSDWRLYDTHYTERYLGDPAADPAAYSRSSLIDDAEKLGRPLLIIHGLVDDNVVVAHTLRLSQALLEAGRLHSVLPLSGVTHMTPQEVVAENLLLLQVAFLRESLGIGPSQNSS
jgi:dipeptidyl-peptidase-4